MKTLITGATGLLGRYLTPMFPSGSVLTLGRGDGNNFVCDLSHDTPDFKGEQFAMVVHCAGTEEDSGSTALNLDGTKRLLQALDSNPPRQLIYISSHAVYSADAGVDIDETSVTWATTEAGRSKARAEAEIEKWGEQHGVRVTILRPAPMFGSGMTGRYADMFADVARGRYVHIRGNENTVSVVTALDVARSVVALKDVPGIFNVADWKAVPLLELAEAMSINAGHHRRMTHLPIKWARTINALLHFIPAIGEPLDRAIEATGLSPRTLSPQRLLDTTGLTLHNTLDVIARRDPNYPYTDQ